MKIIHSYWSKPSLATGHAFLKNDGGWIDKKFHYYSWALSCLKCKEIYGNIELITDRKGFDLLINQLDLPYTNVCVNLDVLNKYHHKLWAIGKLYAYGMQKEPFLHIDGDVFIWEKFEKNILNAPLISQHREIDLPHYREAFQDLERYFQYVPKVIRLDYEKYSKFDAGNAGIFGGNNLDFFRKYTKMAFEFIDANSKALLHKKVIGSRFAILYEQYLFSCMARSEGIEITYLLGNAVPDYGQISDFGNKHFQKNFTHVLDIRKKLTKYCYELENILRLEYPEKFYKIEKMLSDRVLIP